MGSSKKSSDKDRERDREVRKKRRDKSRERRKRRSRSRERGRERSNSRDRARGRSRERSHPREHGREKSYSPDRSRRRSRERSPRERGRKRSITPDRARRRSRERSPRERGRERSSTPDRTRKRSRERSPRERGHERSSTPNRARVRSRERSPRQRGRERSNSGDREGSQSAEIKHESSPSIEETNKLRLSLGLKPLQVDTDTPASEEKVKKEPIHAPPKNMGDIKAQEKLKEKIEVRRESRKISRALGSVKTLGEPSEEEDTGSWIARMRKIEEEKKKAEKKAQMLAEMDEEFGIGDLISDVVKEDRSKVYGAQALKGLKVEHDVSSFKEGRDVTLIIKDSAILDESEDVLLNPNMVEMELASKNVELKKGKPGYNPYEEEEVDELGNVKKQALLGKYDEEIHGEKKKAFVLGAEGEVDTERDREREIIRQRLQEKKISLEMPPVQIASEYYTSEEMVQFKKVKKRRKKVRVKADDLLPLGKEDDSSRDHGSRDHASRSRSQHGDEDDIEDMEISAPAPASTDDLKDEADASMATALSRTRRLLQKTKKAGVESKGVARVRDMLQSRGEEGGKGEETGEDTIVLDTTAEFCKQVGGRGGGEEKDGTSTSDYPYDQNEGHHDSKEEEMDLEEEGGWMEVRKEYTGKKKEAEAKDLYQEAEPLVASGVAAALQLATKKGFVATEAPKKASTSVVQSSSGKRDLEYERQKEKERDRELSRYGREGTFVEKKGYTPNVKIEHVDDSGRVMSIKEAFRYMSHKFHGRTSGRKKTEKRLKKLKQEKLLNSASSVDTPLNTLSVLKSKQKSAQSPYILVSGGAQSLLAPDIAKRK